MSPGFIVAALCRHPSFRVQLDDELFVDRRRLHVLALRQSHHLGFEVLAVLFEPRHRTLALRDVARFEHDRILMHFFLDGDFLAHVDEIGGYVDFLPGHAHMAVQHKLPRLRTRGRQACAPHRVIQTPFEHDDQVFARGALGPHSLLEIVAELSFQQPVGALHLLLLAQLQTITRYLGAPRLPVLSRNEVALLDGTLLREAPQTLQKQLLPLPAAQAADCISVSCQLLFSLPKTLETFRGTATLRSVLAFSKKAHRLKLAPAYQTRRRFGGRHPLCGMGVTSRMTTMCSPAPATARTADSRPEPGPFTRTSTLFIPYWSRAMPAVDSEACCAAYGVPFREPLNPIAPADDQHTTPPSVSVMVICVLFNGAAIYTTPCD